MRKVGVLYTYIDGAHFFVSVDEKAHGLCVAHNDLATAFNAVGPTLAKLFKENRGEDVTFFPEMSLRAFQDWFARRNQEALTMPVPGAAGTMPWSMEERLDDRSGSRTDGHRKDSSTRWQSQGELGRRVLPILSKRRANISNTETVD